MFGAHIQHRNLHVEGKSTNFITLRESGIESIFSTDRLHVKRKNKNYIPWRESCFDYYYYYYYYLAQMCLGPAPINEFLW